MVNVHSFTCYVVNRVEADSKPPDFVWIIALDTPPCQLNPFPVVISECCIVVGVESRTFAKRKKISQRTSDIYQRDCITMLSYQVIVRTKISLYYTHALLTKLDYGRKLT